MRWGLLATLFLALFVGSGCGGTESSGSNDSGNRFDSQRAWELVEQQVKVGQRPAGSSQLRKLAVQLREQLPSGRFEAIPGEPKLRNVVGTLPGVRPGIVVGAHYDTLVTPRGFVGANNGAAGTAVVIGIARALQRIPSDSESREVRFVLFDGEEPPTGLPGEGEDFYNEGLRGSRAYVAAHRGQTREMILLDYVGNRDLNLPREASSSEALWSRLLIAAETAGAAEVFSNEVGPTIVDDHTPFLRAGVPAVDLIDWTYPGHSLEDGLGKLSPASLDAVGEAVTQLVSELRRE